MKHFRPIVPIIPIIIFFLAIAVMFILAHIRIQAERELRRRGFVEVTFQGISVFVLPDQVHLLTDDQVEP